LYIRKTFGGRGGLVLDCNAIQLAGNPKLYDQLQGMFLIDEMFAGIHHTFVVAGGTVEDRRRSLLGNKSEDGVLLQYVEQLFNETNSSYRINSSVKCSFFEYRANCFWDLLALEPTRTCLQRDEHYLHNLTELKIRDVCDFMVYLRIALRTQLCCEHSEEPADLLVRIRITGFDEFTGTYYESTVHFVEYNQQKNLPTSLLGSNEFADYLHPYCLESGKLLIVYCLTDNHYELLEQVDDVQQVLLLKTIEVICREHKKVDSSESYISKFDSIAEEYRSLERLLMGKRTVREFALIYHRNSTEIRKFLDWIDQAL